MIALPTTSTSTSTMREAIQNALAFKAEHPEEKLCTGA